MKDRKILPPNEMTDTPPPLPPRRIFNTQTSENANKEEHEFYSPLPSPSSSDEVEPKLPTPPPRENLSLNNPVDHLPTPFDTQLRSPLVKPGLERASVDEGKPILPTPPPRKNSSLNNPVDQLPTPLATQLRSPPVKPRLERPWSDEVKPILPTPPPRENLSLNNPVDHLPTPLATQLRSPPVKPRLERPCSDEVEPVLPTPPPRENLSLNNPVDHLPTPLATQLRSPPVKPRLERPCSDEVEPVLPTPPPRENLSLNNPVDHLPTPLATQLRSPPVKPRLERPCSDEVELILPTPPPIENLSLNNPVDHLPTSLATQLRSPPIKPRLERPTSVDISSLNNPTDLLPKRRIANSMNLTYFDPNLSDEFLLPPKLPPKSSSIRHSGPSSYPTWDAVKPKSNDISAPKLLPRLEELKSPEDHLHSDTDSDNFVQLRNNTNRTAVAKTSRISDRFKKKVVDRKAFVAEKGFVEVDELRVSPKSEEVILQSEHIPNVMKTPSKERNIEENDYHQIADVSDALYDFLQENSQMLHEEFLNMTQVENTEEVKDSEPTSKKNDAKAKFEYAEKRFIEKMLQAKTETKYDSLKTTFDKPKMNGYFGLLEELIEIHQEHFLPKFSNCSNISDVCDVFIKSENELKMHLTDVWLKDPDLYNTSFAKLNNINGEFMKLPCDQLKIYFQAVQELSTNKDITLDEIDKIKRVSKLITKILSEWIIITTWLKHIRDEKVDMKDIGYVLDREKCNVHYNTTAHKKKKHAMDVFFSEKYIILTVYKNPYYRCVDTLPINKIDIIAYTNDQILNITFGKIEQKVYSLHFDRISRLKIVCNKLKEYANVLEASSKK